MSTAAVVRLAQRRWTTLPGATRGVIWMLLAGLGFSLMVATVMWLGDHLHPFQIAFFRCLIGLMVILPFVVRSRGRVLRTRHGAG